MGDNPIFRRKLSKSEMEFVTGLGETCSKVFQNRNDFFLLFFISDIMTRSYLNATNDIDCSNKVTNVVTAVPTKSSDINYYKDTFHQ